MEPLQDEQLISDPEVIADQTNWRKIAINTKYEKVRRKVKSISFNLDNEADILHFAQSQKDFSNWVKNKILEEIR